MSTALLKQHVGGRIACVHSVAGLGKRLQKPLFRGASSPSIQRQLRASDPKSSGAQLEDDDDLLMSESARKKAEADRLRAAEKFMVIGSGEANCTGCGYDYKPDRGDPDFPVARGTKFQDLPQDYICPVCGATKDKFEARVKVVAGFAENQRYGLGTNSMTSEQKQLLIYGTLAFFFACFLSGYALQ